MANKTVTYSDENTENEPQPLLNFSDYCNSIKSELFQLSSANNLLLIIIYVLLLSTNFSMGLQYAIKPNVTDDVQCYIKELDKVKWSFDQKKNLSSPNKGPTRPGCSYYDIDYSVLTSLTYEDALEESKAMIANRPNPIKCTEYLFKTTLPEQISLVREFNLICERKRYYSFNFFVQVGGALGAFPFGIASDIHGRQPAFIIAGIITIVGGCIIPLAPSLPFFITGKMLVGAGSLTLCMSLLVLCTVFHIYQRNILIHLLVTEFCCNAYRSSLTIIAFVAWYLGSVVRDTLLAPNIKIWRLLEVANGCSFLVVLQSIVFVPESPRWLMNQKQLKKAWSVLELMGSTATPEELPHHPFILSNCLKQTRIFIKAYFQYRTYITVILSGIGALTYYANLALATKHLTYRTNNIITTTCMKIIYLLLIARASYSFSKRCVCCHTFLLLATCFIISIVTDAPIINDIALLTAEILSITVWMVVAVYVLEIFPTSHRATALGLNFSLTQIIRLIYLYYQYELSYKISPPVLKGFFCSFCIISALITVLAPIAHDDIPDTKEDLIGDLTLAEQIAFSY